MGIPTTVLCEVDGLATIVQIGDDLDDAPDGGWAAVEAVFHVGHTVPADAIAGAMPRLRRFSTWYLGDDVAEHALATVSLAERVPTLDALDVQIEPGELETFAPILARVPPRVTELGLRVPGTRASALTPWLGLPALARPTLRLAMNRDLASFVEVLSGVLEPAAPAVSTVEVSFDFGLQSWSMLLRRDARGRWGGVTLELRRRDDKRFAKPSLRDVPAFLDALPSDALSSLDVVVFDIRTTKPDVAAITGALGRHPSLTRATILGVPITLGPRTAEPTAAEKKADATAAAFDALRRDARAVVGDALDTFAPGALAPAVALMDEHAKKNKAKAPASEIVEIATRLLELPVQAEAMVLAALRVVARARPSGFARRLVGILEHVEEGTALDIVRGTEGTPVALLRTEELPVLLDWYESRPDKGGPLNTRNWRTNAWFKDVVEATGDRTTAAELARRLDAGTLTKWKTEVYTSLRQALARRGPKPNATAGTSRS